MTNSDLATQIHQFVDSHVGGDVVVVGVLRYGAHLPSIYRTIDPAGKRIPLLLSHFIEFFPNSFFEDRRFLLLDDTVYQGKQLRNAATGLMARGVRAANIQTAALVVHEDSEWVPDFWCEKLKDHDYIIWKEQLAALARKQLRPVDGDHPLYYFRLRNIRSGEFLLLLQRFGALHAAGEELGSLTLTFALDVDSSVLAEIASICDIHVAPISKLRFYWQEKDGDVLLTVVPIVFSHCDLSRDPLRTLRSLCDALHVNPDNLEKITSRRVLFYYISRGLSALLLLKLFEQLAAFLSNEDKSIRTIDPEEMEFPVSYVLPDEYIEFYNSVRNGLDNLLTIRRPSKLPLVDHWKLPSETALLREPLDAHIPPMYDILEFVARAGDPARYDGKRWSPNSNGPSPVTFEELTQEFLDPLFVSAALDELLDAGLLKASDQELRIGGLEFSRAFEAGGEYNAIRVSRMADALRSVSVPIAADVVRTESRELWYTN